MANKCRIYEVILRNGHKSWTEIHVAQSEGELKNTISSIISADVMLISIKFLSWQPFSLELSNGHDDLEFKTDITNQKINFSRNTLGFEHLRKQFPKLANEIDKFHDNQNK